MNGHVIIPLAGLGESPYADIVCYPKLTRKEIQKRLRELEYLNITAIEFTGNKTVHNIPVLGKGCVGIVVKAHLNSKSIALKIRRIDADREEMRHESRMLKSANINGIGPKFLKQSRDFLVMEYIEGRLLPEWLKRTAHKRKIRDVLRSVLEQCFQMDHEGLDHGELSHAPKHIIVRDSAPVIIDFETASKLRRTQNVTAISQYFFMANQFASLIRRKFGSVDTEKLKEALRNYKTERTRESFETILQIVNLD